MEKLIIWMEDAERYEGAELEDRGENTDFEYNIGEEITVNSSADNVYRCMKKEVVNGKLFQYFKKGRVYFDFGY